MKLIKYFLPATFILIFLSACTVQTAQRQVSRPIQAESFDQAWQASVDALIALGYPIQSVSKEAQVMSTEVVKYLGENSRGGYTQETWVENGQTNTGGVIKYEWRLVVRVQKNANGGATVRALVQNYRILLADGWNPANWRNVSSGGSIEKKFYDQVRSLL